MSIEKEVVEMESSRCPLPLTSTPSLVFSHGKNNSNLSFCTLDGNYYTRNIPDMCRMKCIASCYGWLIMQDSKKYRNCYLFNPISLTKIHIPPLKHRTFRTGILTSPPTESNCIVLFVSTKRRSYIWCRIGDTKWIEKQLLSKSDNLVLEKCRLASCNGKIYALHVEVLFVIDIHDNFATKTYNRHWLRFRPRADGQHFIHFRVESCGEIFHVTQQFLGRSDCITQTVDVYRLEFSTMEWVLVESLGDRIFLLCTTSSTSVSSIELGVKGDCIYFPTEVDTTLQRFDMVDGMIMTTLPCPKDLSDYWGGPFWVVPNCKPQFQTKKSAAKVDEEGKYIIYGDLPLDILNIILSRPVLDDCTRFRLAFNRRETINPPIQPYASLLQSESKFQHLPWLLSFSKFYNGICKFYHPIQGVAYKINIPQELEGAIVRHAKDGWLLMSQGMYLIFFFKPSTMEIIRLPETDDPCEFENISFSSPPTSSDCVVFGHYGCRRIRVYRKCDDSWSTHLCPTTNLEEFVPSHCSPLFCDGLFYSLAKDGRLSVFDPKETREENMWRLLPNVLASEVIPSQPEWYLELLFFRSYIVEYDGEIVSVFLGDYGTSVWIYKLDRSDMKWVRLESLGDKVIFLSHASSILVPAELKGVGNRIYLPRLSGRDILFYSLSTRKYHCFGEESCEDWIDTSEDWNCTWIQINK